VRKVSLYVWSVFAYGVPVAPRDPFIITRPSDVLFDIDLTERPSIVVRPRLTIRLAAAIGRGPTTLSAFDHALVGCGIANFNLLRLSSVIPPGSAIEVAEGTAVTSPAGAWGDRLYVVMAEARVDEPGHEAWAGIGWVQDADSGRGLFVEHEGTSRASVEGDITASLSAMVAIRPGCSFGPPQMLVRGATCEGPPICAMVAAAYESDPWRGEPDIQLG
jgi:arginine decarboxylase